MPNPVQKLNQQIARTRREMYALSAHVDRIADRLDFTNVGSVKMQLKRVADRLMQIALRNS